MYGSWNMVHNEQTDMQKKWHIEVGTPPKKCAHTGPILQIKAVFNIGQKVHYFLKKKSTKNFNSPYSIIFPSVLHQNKALHNFHKRG